jgi:hypothetical protein
MIWLSVPNAGYPLARALNGRWHSHDLPYHLMQFTPQSVLRAGALAELKPTNQRTESLPENVSASIGLYLRYKWNIPRRFSSLLPLKYYYSNQYAKRVDAEKNGESIITEFSR